MQKYKLVLKVKDMGFNGTDLTSDVEVTINANDRTHAEEKAQRAVDNFVRFSGSKVSPTYTLAEVS